jgi:hypothetical protein
MVGYDFCMFDNEFLGNPADLPLVADKTFIMQSCNDATSARQSNLMIICLE